MLRTFGYMSEYDLWVRTDKGYVYKQSYKTCGEAVNDGRLHDADFQVRMFSGRIVAQHYKPEPNRTVLS